jgi:hypothetical protein
VEGKLIDGGLLGFSRERLSILSALQMNNIRGNEIRWEIIHPFIKSHMFSDLDHMGFGIIPDDILIGVGDETKEDSLAGVGN